MKLKQKRKISGEDINSILFDNNYIKVELKNGNKFTCKPIGSMNLASWIDYNEDINTLIKGE